jgi:hypothetical protein
MDCAALELAASRHHCYLRQFDSRLPKGRPAEALSATTPLTRHSESGS